MSLSYSGNKLTLIDTEEDNYTEVWTVTTMTENELVYELREKEKEDGTTYEYTYYWGSAWDKAAIKTQDAWNKYMAEYAQKLRTPLAVAY